MFIILVSCGDMPSFFYPAKFYLGRYWFEFIMIFIEYDEIAAYGHNRIYAQSGPSPRLLQSCFIKAHSMQYRSYIQAGP